MNDTPPATAPILRPTSRILVLDPQDRLLLFFAMIGHSVEPQRRPDATGFWALPGGGLEPGETHEAAAVRELHEETGIVALGEMACIATRDVTYPWKGRHYRSRERYYFTRVASDRIDASGWQEGDTRWMSQLGWWDLARLEQSPDIIRPPGLLQLARRVQAGQLPGAPVELPA